MEKGEGELIGKFKNSMVFNGLIFLLPLVHSIKYISMSHYSQALIDNNYSDDNINLPDGGKGVVS